MTITEAYAMLIDRLGPGTYSIDIGTWNREGRISVDVSVYADIQSDLIERYTTDSHASLEDAVLCLIAKAGGKVSAVMDDLNALSEEAGRLAKDTDRALNIITGGQA